MLCSVPLTPFYIKIGWAMWMVVGRPPDEACGSGTGAGTLWAGALPDAPGPFVPATKKGCATAASATCQGTIQCRQPAKAKRETTRASWRDQVEGIARKADPGWPLVATCHTRQACVMVVRCGLERACDCSARWWAVLQ